MLPFSISLSFISAHLGCIELADIKEIRVGQSVPFAKQVDFNFDVITEKETLHLAAEVYLPIFFLKKTFEFKT